MTVTAILIQNFSFEIVCDHWLYVVCPCTRKACVPSLDGKTKLSRHLCQRKRFSSSKMYWETRFSKTSTCSTTSHWNHKWWLKNLETREASRSTLFDFPFVYGTVLLLDLDQLCHVNEVKTEPVLPLFKRTSLMCLESPDESLTSITRALLKQNLHISTKSIYSKQ